MILFSFHFFFFFFCTFILSDIYHTTVIYLSIGTPKVLGHPYNS